MRRIHFALVLSLVTGALFFAACGPGETGSGGSKGGKATPVIGLTVDYPLEGSLFPPDFTPPTFLWHDDTPGVDTWILTVSFASDAAPVTLVSSGPPPATGEIDRRALGPTNEIHEPSEYQRTAKSWTPAADLWSRIQAQSVEGPATLRLKGVARGRSDEVLSQAELTFSTSTDPVGAPVFYRDVPLMPSRGEDGKISPLDKSAVPLISWRLRDLSMPDSKVVLTRMPTCANCHSFSQDGRTLGMDVDGPDGDKGTYAIAPIEKTTVIGDNEVITWNSFQPKPEGHKTFGFLSRISPDGKWALSTVNESLYVANFTTYKFLQVFFPTRGILASYSTESGRMKALPGADDPAYVQCTPVWFPDGKEIVFARAKAFDPYPPGQPLATYAGDPNEPRIQYDLYRMPFNEGRGGTPVAIEGASHNGMSNTFPKISPDGKWLVYTKCENGLLMRPDGRLWIVPAGGGTAREMNCNTRLMNSWHSFSPNGRWMVFSSKSNTPYTQMFLTHLDEDGNDTPAILVPNSTAANRAVNIPEFVNREFDSFDLIEVPAVKQFYELQDGMDLVRTGRFEEAIPLLERALERDPEFARALVALGFALLEAGRYDEARVRLMKAIEVDPRSSLARVNLGLTYQREGLTSAAAEQFEMAATIDPSDRLAHHNLGLVRLEQGEFLEAEKSLSTAMALEPRNPDVHNALGFVLQRLGRRDDALAEYRLALQFGPDHPLALANLAVALRESGDNQEAVQFFRRGVEVEPGNMALRRMLCENLLALGLAEEAMPHFDVLLKDAPEDPSLCLSVAWLLATHPDDQVRDGARAVQLASTCLRTGPESAAILDVLAAAYAEAGRFDEAVKTATRALELWNTGKQAGMPGIEDRLKEYRAGRPHRQ